MIGRDALALARAKPLAQSAEIVAFGHRATDEYVSLIEQADGPIAVEMFSLGPNRVTKALRKQASAGIRTEVTIDRIAAEKSFTAKLKKSGATLTTYDAARAATRGSAPSCLHSKAIVAGSHGMISTGTITRFTPQKLELSVLLDREASAALKNVIDASRAGDPTAIRRTATAALDHGIVLNDPLGGVRHIDQELHGLVDDATKNVELVTKELDDVTFTERLVAAKQRGVDVRLVVGDLAEADAQLLTRGGVTVEQMPFRNHGLDVALQHRLHFTSLLRDDATRGYFGSHYPWHGGIGRELGVVVEGPLARRAHEAVEEQIGRSTPRIVGDAVRQQARTAAHHPLATAAVAGGGVGGAVGGAELLQRGRD